MGVKSLVFIIVILFLFSGCADKTQPIISDISGVSDSSDSESLDDISGDVVKDINDVEYVGDDSDETDVDDDAELNDNEDNPDDVEVDDGVHTVLIKGLKLNPKELEIKKGDTVIWEHNDDWESDGPTKHYFAAHSNEFRTPILYKGDTFEHTFEEEGTYTYLDIIYKDRGNLYGKIIVE
jgi:plastocyanin